MVHGRRYSHKGKPHGSVLIFTLWLIVALAATALLSGQSAALAYQQNANQQAGAQAELAADATARYVAEVLAAREDPTILPDSKAYEAEDLRIGDCRVWILGRPADLTGDEPVFALQDEAARLPLNTAELEMIAALPGMPAPFAAAIVDWRDTDSEPGPDGAESTAYLSLDPPRLAKDGPFESVAELGRVYDAEAARLTGRDRNRNGVIEDWEDALIESRGQRFDETPERGLLEQFTVHIRELNQDPEGNQRTDLNGNAGQVIQALSQRFGQRGTTIAGQAGVGSRQFQSVLEFCLRGGLSTSEAATAYDYFTVGSDEVLSGRVNVNTAGAEVLACLPGVGEDGAASLIDHRDGLSDAEELAAPTWIATVLGQENAMAAGPWVTTKSFQVAADIVAVGPRGHAFKRVRYVFDCTGDRPVIISRRDLTHLGWPLGQALYDELHPQEEAH